MAGDNHERFPEFFEVYRSEINSERMCIPGYFIRGLKGVIPEKTILRNNLGECWGVEVKKTEQRTFFQGGWKPFCVASSIRNGDFLVFQYNGEVFDCRVFGNSMCETTIPPSRETREEVLVVLDESEEEDIKMEEHEDDHDHDDHHHDDGEAGEEACDEDDVDHDGDGEAGEEAGDKDDDHDHDDDGEAREEAGDEDCDDGEAEADDEDEDGTGHMPLTNPSFVALWRPRTKRGTKRAKLYVPGNLIKDNNIELADTMIFQDPYGRKWPGKVSIWGNGSTWIGDWKLFCNKNNVKEGDICICEFMLHGEGHRCTRYDCIHRCEKIKVRIIRKVD